MKKLIPATVMLLVAAVLMSTASFAWFSMNTTVTATNMQVKAVSEQGILINEVSNKASTNWDNSATTNQTEPILLHATSTANTGTWYVAYSKLSNDAAVASSGTVSGNLVDGAYKTLGTGTLTTATSTEAAADGTNAARTITYVDANSNTNYDNGEGYYVMYTYYLKSSGDELSLSTAAKGQTLNIKSVEVASAGISSSGGALEIDKALRVAVVVNGKAYIYAPIDGAATSYYVAAASTATTATAGNVSRPTDLASLPAITADTPITVNVYIYFEGEDPGLKTENVVAALDNLNVTVSFELVKNDSAVTPDGVSVS